MDSMKYEKIYIEWSAIYVVYMLVLSSVRHSYASLLVNNGANITVVVKYLGHTKIKETLNTYTHLFNSALNEIVALIDRLE